MNSFFILVHSPPAFSVFLRVSVVDFDCGSALSALLFLKFVAVRDDFVELWFSFPIFLCDLFCSSVSSMIQLLILLRINSRSFAAGFSPCLCASVVNFLISSSSLCLLFYSVLKVLLLVAAFRAVCSAVNCNYFSLELSEHLTPVAV